MTIRKAESRDLDAIEELYGEIFDAQEAGAFTTGWIRGVYPTRETAEAGLTRDDLYVLEDGGRLLGCAVINQKQVDVYAGAPWQYDEPDGRVCVMHTLVIRPSERGKGCGRAFFDYYEELARRSGWPELRIDTNARNRSAREIYRKLGYREIGTVPTVFNGIPGVELVLLEKHLESKPG